MDKYNFYALTGLTLLLTTPILSAADSIPSADATKNLTPKQQLGQKIFFDTQLSTPSGQSCASCHDIKTSLTEPDLDLPVSKGAAPNRVGERNTPTAMYSAFSPVFHYDAEEDLFIGGQFLDGRAASLEEQAQQPFLNPDEMNNANADEVIAKIRHSDYVDLFNSVFGPDSLSKVDTAFEHVAAAIAAFESTNSFNRFTSKFDYHLAGIVKLSEQEQRGLELFEAEDKGNCAACHLSAPVNGKPPLFTDFTYDNLGVPANPDILQLKGNEFIDLGLGKTVSDSEQNGKFKVPTLRNLAKTAPYMHNGVFTTMHEVVDFYNTRDTDPKWPAAEVAENVNKAELGELNLSDDEVDAIVAFLQTLTDGYTVNAQPAYSLSTSVLNIPYVIFEDNNNPATIFSAQFEQITTNQTVLFKLIDYKQLSSADPSPKESLPTYSTVSKILEIPNLKTEGNSGSGAEYIAQLKRLNSNGNSFFELSYLKQLQ